MKITDPQVILNGEQDLIESVQKDLDLDAVKDLLKERLTASALSPKGGRIVVHDNNVAFRLDYEINLNGSLLFDRNGNLLEDSEMTAPKQNPQDEEELDDNLSINLPDYDDITNNSPGETQPVDLEQENLSDNIQDAEPELEIEDPEDEAAFDQDDSDSIEAEDGDELTDIGPEDGDRETGENKDVDDEELDDNLSINLPDYDDITNNSPVETQPVDLEQENLSDDIQDAGPELEIEDPEDEAAFDQDDSDSIEAEDDDELTNIGPEDGDRETGENKDVDDDDINDLLQESRDFWEKKKE